MRYEAVPRVTGDWDTHSQSPLADPVWIRSFVDAFGERATIHTLCDGGRVIAALPVVRGGSRLARAWVSVDNEHNPYWLMPGTLDPASAERMLDTVLGDAEYLFLRRFPVRDPNCIALVDAARRRGMPVVQIESSGDARMVLDGPWSEFRARLPKNFQRDLPRKQRQLEKQGALSLVEHAEPGPALDAALTECFDIETRGWKGTDGSPILRDPRTLRFYTELARGLAATKRFTLYTLVLGDKIIAFEYCLRGGGHIEMLKLSFDPAFEKQSPGQVLRMLLLERELERGEVRYYHLGRPSEWKLRWATEVAPLCTLRIFANTARGRAAHLVGPVLRGYAKVVRAELRRQWSRLDRAAK